MSQTFRNRRVSFLDIVVGLLIFVIFFSVVGFFSFFTNSFTSSFKTFYVKVNGKTIMNDGEHYEIVTYVNYRFDVKYAFGFMQKENEKLGYHVQIIPNITDETKFNFTVNGDKYGYEGETDLTQGFDLILYDDYFTLTAKKDLPDILSDLYLGSRLTGVPNAIDSGKNYFTLIIFSEDKSTKLSIDFNLVSVAVAGTELFSDSIAF